MVSVTDVRKLLTDLNAWDGEIPSAIVHAGNFKVRKNWFEALVNTLYLAVLLGLVSDVDAQEKIRVFNIQCPQALRGKERTTEEDIERGDQIIALALTHLHLPQAA